MTKSLSRTQRERKGRNFALSSILGAHFRLYLSSAAAFHCPHFLKIRRLGTRFRDPGLFCNGPFEALRDPSQAREGAFKAREGLLKNTVGK